MQKKAPLLRASVLVKTSCTCRRNGLDETCYACGDSAGSSQSRSGEAFIGYPPLRSDEHRGGHNHRSEEHQPMGGCRSCPHTAAVRGMSQDEAQSRKAAHVQNRALATPGLQHRSCPTGHCFHANNLPSAAKPEDIYPPGAFGGSQAAQAPVGYSQAENNLASLPCLHHAHGVPKGHALQGPMPGSAHARNDSSNPTNQMHQSPSPQIIHSSGPSMAGSNIPQSTPYDGYPAPQACQHCEASRDHRQDVAVREHNQGNQGNQGNQQLAPQYFKHGEVFPQVSQDHHQDAAMREHNQSNQVNPGNQGNQVNQVNQQLAPQACQHYEVFPQVSRDHRQDAVVREHNKGNQQLAPQAFNQCEVFPQVSQNHQQDAVVREHNLSQEMGNQGNQGNQHLAPQAYQPCNVFPQASQEMGNQGQHPNVQSAGQIFAGDQNPAVLECSSCGHSNGPQCYDPAAKSYPYQHVSQYQHVPGDGYPAQPSAPGI